MGYIRAEDVLPENVLDLIQQYVDGQMIYIPRKEGCHHAWGSKTDTKKELKSRNDQICASYCTGMSVKELAEDYCLTEKSIQRIIRAHRKREQYMILKISENRHLKERAAYWFHEKWGIPQKAYEESMEECIKNRTAVPQWYVVIENSQIIGGLGVIENDFHDRKDLTPNVCAVYVEEKYRCQGIAGKMLEYVCEDMSKKGIDTLYLVTDHTSFYERYGWEFFCMVQGDGEPAPGRMYVHRI